MGKKGKCKNHKDNQKHKQLKKSKQKALIDGGDSDDQTFNIDSSQYSANAVNCVKCLKAKNEHPYSHGPSIKEIMDIFGKKPTMKNFKHSLQLLNELVDNYDISERIAEIIQQGVDVILIQGMQFTNSTIQYYAIHALSVITKYMNETQLKNLIPCGLLKGFAAALQSDMYFIIQEAIEACSSIATKSVAVRDILATFGSLHISELLSMYDQVISREFASVIATFLRRLCYLKPVPEFILRRVANSARYLLRHEDYEIRIAALDAIFEVVSNKDFTVTFEDAYMEIILKFLDSPRRSEVRAAFNIASEFTKQRNCNTNELIKAGFIGKIMSVLARNSTPDFGYDACSILARILTNKNYIESAIESGLILLLIGLMDEGTNLYKNKACKALICMYSNIDRKNAIRLADEIYLEKICNILMTNDKNNCIACALSLLNCILKGCSKGNVDRQLNYATQYITESEAYKYITKYINSECFKIQNLAENVYHQLNDNSKDNTNKEEMVS